MATDENKKFQYTINKKDNGVVNLSIEISWSYFEEERNRILLELGKDIEIKGFRKGFVPINILEQRFGRDADFHTLQNLGSKITKKILGENKETVLSPIHTINISPLKKEEPVKFTLRFLGLPKVSIKGLEEIKVEKKKKINVSKEEVSDVLKELWEAKRNKKENKQSSTIFGPDGKPIDVSKVVESNEKFDENKLDDNWARSINPHVSNLAELKDLITNALKREKEKKEEERWAGIVLDKISEEYSISVPKEILDPALVAEEERFYQILRNMGISPADYIASGKVSIDDLRKKWKISIETALKRNIVTYLLANYFNITVSPQEVKDQAKKSGKNEEDIRHSLIMKKTLEKLEDKLTLL
jgi:FKBP-type peptidyl-prolyl cis-trans isomerase (trigger factor)